MEALLVVVTSSVLAAIAAPGWLAFKDRQALNGANDQVYLAMREAQSQAIRTKTTWQASFREINNTVEWTVHQAGIEPDEAAWSPLDDSVQLDAETTLREAGGVRRVRFDYRGKTSGQLGRVTLSSQNGSKAKRCTIVSTLLGTLRKGREQAKPLDGKYCY